MPSRPTPTSATAATVGPLRLRSGLAQWPRSDKGKRLACSALHPPPAFQDSLRLACSEKACVILLLVLRHHIPSTDSPSESFQGQSQFTA